jgi:hypothetical protein
VRSLFIALALLGACSPPVATPQSTPSQARIEITASCGGGFTGGGSGVTITAADHVVRWQQATAGAQRSESDLGVRSAFAADIRGQLDAIRFAEINYDQPGNMTCSLSAGDHSVSWSQGDANAPSAVVEVHAAVLAAAP